MIFTPTPLEGAFVLESERKADNRGHFARAYCVEEFRAHGIDCTFLQDSISFNRQRNTLRGMHHQREPFGEEKVVRCISGRVYDVIVDIRADSPTCLKWFGVELSAEKGNALFIPQGFAHGFQTLCDNTALYYKVSASYCPEAATGLPFDDPSVAVVWQTLDTPMILSEQDQHWGHIRV